MISYITYLWGIIFQIFKNDGINILLNYLSWQIWSLFIILQAFLVVNDGYREMPADTLVLWKQYGLTYMVKIVLFGGCHDNDQLSIFTWSMYIHVVFLWQLIGSFQSSPDADLLGTKYTAVCYSLCRVLIDSSAGTLFILR